MSHNEYKVLLFTFACILPYNFYMFENIWPTSMMTNYFTTTLIFLCRNTKLFNMIFSQAQWNELWCATKRSRRLIFTVPCYFYDRVEKIINHVSINKKRTFTWWVFCSSSIRCTLIMKLSFFQSIGCFMDHVIVVYLSIQKV